MTVGNFTLSLELFFFIVYILVCSIPNVGFPAGSDSKESACNARDLGLIPGLGRSPGEGYGYSVKYSGLENPMDRGTRRATVHGVTKSQSQLID